MNKKILYLAIPNIISNLSVPLLTSVDTALMGRMESEIYIGAIALGGLIFNFVYWSFGFLRMGSTGLTAQAFGEKNDAKLMQILGRALIFGFVSGLVLLLSQKWLMDFGF
ncbi:MAG: MATE family efflux transporter, partial [Saprospiraceae bacterium]